MRVGDMVYFYSTYMPFKKDYADRNPGIVLEKSKTESACVLWSNGDVTNEHNSYLKKIKEEKIIEE